MESIIAGMSMIIWMFVIGIVVLTTVKRMKRLQGKSAAKNNSYTSADKLYASSGQANGNKRNIQVKKNRNTGDGMILKDDRNNDWLAGQLREEARAKARISDMFQMKIDHANNCEAEFIKRFHESVCDAEGIDTAKGKRKN